MANRERDGANSLASPTRYSPFATRYSPLRVNTMLNVTAIDLHYGAAQALRAVSLTARPGEVTCVLGRNGVGKTSLLRALIGQHPISRGAIVFYGHDITKLRPYERARNGIAYVPQGREIFPLLTVEENLKTGFAPLG